MNTELNPQAAMQEAKRISDTIKQDMYTEILKSAKKYIQQEVVESSGYDDSYGSFII